MGLVRLNRYLVLCGISSRRKADRLIEEGRILVNGKPAKLGQRINPEVDTVTLDGKVLRPQRFVYLKYYKPRFLLTSVGDPRGRPNLSEVLSEVRSKLGVRVFPVGRLDFDAEGLLILTNDGILANRIAHPRYTLLKEYIVWLDEDLRERDLRVLKRGLILEGKLVEVHKLRKLGPRKYLISIHVGMYHVVKRLFGQLGRRVVRLLRSAVGPVKLGNLKPGEWRSIPGRELRELFKVLRYK